MSFSSVLVDVARASLGFACFYMPLMTQCMSNPARTSAVGRTAALQLEKGRHRSVEGQQTRIHYYTLRLDSCMCIDASVTWIIVSFVPLLLLFFCVCVCCIVLYCTSLIGDHTRVIEEQVTETVAVRIDGWFSTQTRRMEDGERLKSPQSRLAFGHRRCRTRHCGRHTKTTTATRNNKFRCFSQFLYAN